MVTGTGGDRQGGQRRAPLGILGILGPLGPLGILGV